VKARARASAIADLERRKLALEAKTRKMEAIAEANRAKANAKKGDGANDRGENAKKDDDGDDGGGGEKDEGDVVERPGDVRTARAREFASRDSVKVKPSANAWAGEKERRGERRASLDGRPAWRAPSEDSFADVGASVKEHVEAIEERIKATTPEKVNGDGAASASGESEDENAAPDDAFKTPAKASNGTTSPASTPSKTLTKTPSVMKTKLSERLSEAREIAAANAKELAASPLRSTFKQRFGAPREPNALEKIQSSVRRFVRRAHVKLSALTDRYPKQVAGGVGAIALIVLVSQRRGRDVVSPAARKKR